MYVAQMKPKLLITIGRWAKLISDFQVVRQVVRHANETVSFHELSGKLDARQVARISPSSTKNRSHRCIRQTECKIKDFTKMVNEFRTKNTMKNYYYEGPTFKLWGASQGSTFTLQSGEGGVQGPQGLVPLLHHA